MSHERRQYKVQIRGGEIGTCDLESVLLNLFSVQFSSGQYFTLTYHYSVQFSLAILCRREHALIVHNTSILTTRPRHSWSYN